MDKGGHWSHPRITVMSGQDKPLMELRLRKIKRTPSDNLKAVVETKMVTEVYLNNVLCNEWVWMKDHSKRSEYNWLVNFYCYLLQLIPPFPPSISLFSLFFFSLRKEEELCRGFSEMEKRDEIGLMFEECRLNILVLIETKLRRRGRDEFWGSEKVNLEWDEEKMRERA